MEQEGQQQQQQQQMRASASIQMCKQDVDTYHSSPRSVFDWPAACSPGVESLPLPLSSSAVRGPRSPNSQSQNGRDAPSNGPPSRASVSEQGDRVSRILSLLKRCCMCREAGWRRRGFRVCLARDKAGPRAGTAPGQDGGGI